MTVLTLLFQLQTWGKKKLCKNIFQSSIFISYNKHKPLVFWSVSVVRQQFKKSAINKPALTSLAANRGEKNEITVVLMFCRNWCISAGCWVEEHPSSIPTTRGRRLDIHLFAAYWPDCLGVAHSQWEAMGVRLNAVLEQVIVLDLDCICNEINSTSVHKCWNYNAFV